MAEFAERLATVTKLADRADAIVAQMNKLAESAGKQADRADAAALKLVEMPRPAERRPVEDEEAELLANMLVIHPGAYTSAGDIPTLDQLSTATHLQRSLGALITQVEMGGLNDWHSTENLPERQEKLKAQYARLRAAWINALQARLALDLTVAKIRRTLALSELLGFQQGRTASALSFLNSGVEAHFQK
ncbi:MAG: hypothetical protein K2Z81_27830 [Cyanobacteria bacterium]|nr:hypothetical protein [Cyanobacteriota bacterium]